MILVLDYGSQYTQLIARRVREASVYSVIQPYGAEISKELFPDLKGIILSGGPGSVYADSTFQLNAMALEMGVPLLGICYGAQLLVQHHGGEVSSADQREFGRAGLTISDKSDLFKGIENNKLSVWMSHGDRIDKISDIYDVIATSENSPNAAIRHQKEAIFGLQFHPEVYHTESGADILRNFVIEVCGCEAKWTSEAFVEESIEQVRQQVGDNQVICAVSGGVDSTVLAVLLHKAIGERSHCVFIDNGLLRENEAEQVQLMLRDDLGVNLHFENASAEFLKALAGVTDPEKKRKAIGKTFIDVFERLSNEIPNAKFLAQGTLYPDLIESVSQFGPSATIKSHHNVGGLPDHMNLKLVEPLRELFKDEVRAVGSTLGISATALNRHPFPGPGLAIRLIGEVAEERLNVLREADTIFIEELRRSGQYDQVWQAFAALLPVKTVGVMGDLRTYENVLAIRAVSSTDGMTADWSRLPYDLLATISTRIINEVKGVNRVVYDISSKPPGTIEWE